MQINSNLHNSTTIIRDVPAKLLTALAEKPTLSATVLTATSAGTVRLQVADMVVQVTSDQNLKPGQQVQLQQQQEAGKTVVKVVPVEAALQTKPASVPVLQQGEQLNVDVVKLLADNTLLVRPTSAPGVLSASPALPAEIAIDVSAIKARFTPGDKLLLEVLRTQPLAVAIKVGQPASTLEQIATLQQHLLTQIKNSPGSAFDALNQVLQTKTAISPLLSQAIEQLSASLAEKTTLQQPETLKQSLKNSGHFLEQRLLSVNSQAESSNGLQQDVKANLLQLGQIIRQLTQQPQLLNRLAQPEVLATLPEVIQKAIIQLNQQPQALRQLPAQVPTALATTGQTPMQLLLGLLTGMSQSVTDKLTATELASTAKAFSLPAAPPVTTTAQASAANATRQAEWQLLREVLRDVEGLTSRIQHNQLAMVRDAETPSNMNVWLFDLPVKDKQQLELLQLRLEQHLPDKPGGEDIWQVQLNLETANLGPMQARISLQQYDVTVTLLAQWQSSADMLQQHMASLNQRLSKLGVNVSQLQCRQATIVPLNADKPVASTSSQLVDISV